MTRRAPIYEVGDTLFVQNTDNPDTRTECLVIGKRPVKLDDGGKTSLHDYDIVHVSQPDGKVHTIRF
jgi:hypothetical protein